MAVQRGGRGRVELVQEGIHRAGGTATVGTDIDADLAAPLGMMQRHILDRDNIAMVAAPVLYELSASALLQLVVAAAGCGPRGPLDPSNGLTIRHTLSGSWGRRKPSPDQPDQERP